MVARFTRAKVDAVGRLRPFSVVASFQVKVVSGCKRSRIAHDAFFYVTDYVREDKTYMKCSVAQGMCCKGRGIWTAEGFVKTAEHSHAPNQSVIERAKARAVMKERVEGTGEPVHAVRDAAKRDMSLAARADMPREGDISRSIRRYRKRARQAPAEPATIGDLVISPELGLTQESRGLPATRFLLYDSGDDGACNGRRIVLYSSDWGLQNLAYSLHWAADGTFKVSPVLFQQLYTIHATVLSITMPCAYALLENKSAHTYRQVLSKVRAAIHESHPDAPGLGGTVMTDLERAAMNAIQEVFPQKLQSTCFFHLAQNVWKKVQNVGLQQRYADDADFALQVRSLLAIAFLPPADIPAAFHAVAESLPDDVLREYAHRPRAWWEMEAPSLRARRVDPVSVHPRWVGSHEQQH